MEERTGKVENVLRKVRNPKFKNAVKGLANITLASAGTTYAASYCVRKLAEAKRNNEISNMKFSVGLLLSYLGLFCASTLIGKETVEVGMDLYDVFKPEEEIVKEEGNE